MKSGPCGQCEKDQAGMFGVWGLAFGVWMRFCVRDCRLEMCSTFRRFGSLRLRSGPAARRPRLLLERSETVHDRREGCAPLSAPSRSLSGAEGGEQEAFLLLSSVASAPLSDRVTAPLSDRVTAPVSYHARSLSGVEGGR